MVILAKHATRDVEMAFERCARSILMLHYSGEYESGCERYSEGISHSLVVLVESVFHHV